MPYEPYGKEFGVITVLRDGRVIAYGQASEVVGSGTVSINVRVPDLKYIEYVLEVEVHTNPDTEAYGIRDKKITGNVVGMTLTTGAGTTLTVGVIALGPGA